MLACVLRRLVRLHESATTSRTPPLRRRWRYFAWKQHQSCPLSKLDLRRWFTVPSIWLHLPRKTVSPVSVSNPGHLRADAESESNSSPEFRLLITKRHHGIDLGGGTGWDVSCENRGGNQEYRHQGQRQWVMRLYTKKQPGEESGDGKRSHQTNH